MHVLILVVSIAFILFKYLNEGFASGLIWSTLALLGAVSISFAAERFGAKSYYCPYCRRRVDPTVDRCECGAPVLARRAVSLDSIPLVIEQVIVRRSVWVHIAVFVSLVLVGAGLILPVIIN